MTRSLNLGAAMLVAAMLGACGSNPPAETPKPAAEAPKPVAEAPQPVAQAPAQPAVQAEVVKAPAARVSMPAQRSVYYDFDKYAVKSEFTPIIQANVEYLNDNSGAKVRIEGNCDERGSRSYNLALGQRRADAVKNAMKLLGVAEQRIETVSFGEEKPKVRGSNEAAWAENRRSDIVFQ